MRQDRSLIQFAKKAAGIAAFDSTIEAMALSEAPQYVVVRFAMRDTLCGNHAEVRTCYPGDVLGIDGLGRFFI